MTVQFTVYGQCYSLKNSHIWGRGRSVKNPAAVKFEHDFAAQVPPEYRNLCLGGRERPRSAPVMLSAVVKVFYPSWRQDMDEAIVWDLLQKTGVIRNDRWIRRKSVDATEIDAVNPRVVITLEEIT